MSVSKTAQKGPPVNAEESILSKPTNRGTPSRVRTYLNTYAECGSVKAAAKVAGIHRSMHYRKLEGDVEYRKAFDAMEDRVGQELEDLAIERVRNGVKRQLFWRDKPIKTKNGHSSIRSSTTPNCTSQS